MPHKEIEILNIFPWGCISRKACDTYWEIIRYYLIDKDKRDETLKENLDDLLYEYT